MADEQQEAQEIVGTPLYTEADATTDWGQNVQMIEPGQEIPAEATEEAEAETEVTETETAEQETQDPVQAEAEPVIELEAPGDYTPADYSFEVITYDDEGKKPKTHVIKSPEQFQELLEQDANFGSPAALLKANNLAAKMEVKEEQDRAAHEAKVKAYEEAKQKQDKAAQAVEQTYREIQYLFDKGKLPRVSNEHMQADWSDPGNAKLPGVTELTTLLKYMNQENAARAKAGIAPMNVVDAHTAMTLEKQQAAAQKAKSDAAERRKQAGAMVAGNSPAPIGNVPKGIAVGRVNAVKNLGW